MKIELRPYVLADASSLAALANDYDVSKYLRNTFPHPYTYEDAQSFLQMIVQLPVDKGIEYAIYVGGSFAGAIGITFSTDVYEKTCELGYWLGKPFWGQGIMQEAVAMLISHLFHNFPVHKITAEVFAPNIASAKILEKNNFILEGILKEHVYKHSQYYDVMVYGLCRNACIR